MVPSVVVVHHGVLLLKPRYVTGVGSEETPSSVDSEIEAIMRLLVPLGYVLRSGAARGFDSMAERWAARLGGETEIFLPWKGFGDHPSRHHKIPPIAFEIAREHMSQYHWFGMSPGAQACHARDVQQVLGQHCGPPSIPTSLLFCWTPGGKIVGGTATAIKVATAHGIPVFNLYNPTPLFGSTVIEEIRALVSP